jgi:hypothetical protein
LAIIFGGSYLRAQLEGGSAMGRVSADFEKKFKKLVDTVPDGERDHVYWRLVKTLVNSLGGGVPPASREDEGPTEPPTDSEFTLLPTAFLDKAEVSLKDYVDGIVLDNKYDQLLAVVAYLQEQLQLCPITMSEIATCYRYLRWSAEPDPIKLRSALWNISYEHEKAGHRKFFIDIANGRNVVLSPDGIDYVASLPRRKRRGGTR